MTVEDYVSLSKSEFAFGNSLPTCRVKQFLAGLASVRSDQMGAVLDAERAEGAHPLVIYAPSFSGVAWENADLCEYLASHGYMVASSPSFGVSSREMTSDCHGIRAQARDISRLIDLVETMGCDRGAGTVVIGYSWGGLSNVAAAADDTRIRGLVSLDGSMCYFGALLEEVGVDPTEMEIPLLYFEQGDYRPSGQDPPPDVSVVLGRWTRGDLLHLKMPRMNHAEFGSMLQRNEEIAWKAALAYERRPDQERSGSSDYSWVARYTLAFLDRYLKGSREAEAFLSRSPAENGAAPEIVSCIVARSGQPSSVSFDAFEREVARRGFDRLDEIYQEFRLLEPTFGLSEEAIQFWSESLAESGAVRQAVAVQKWNVALRPASPSAWLRLGETYWCIGDRTRSVSAFRRCLEIDPANLDARWRLNCMNAGVA